MWYHKKACKAVFKYNKIFLGVLMLVYVSSVAICSLDFNGMDGDAGNDHFPDIHCGIDLNNYAPSEDRSASLNDFSGHWRLLPRVIEPHLPILSFSIFKVPKPA
jgi:hypothetical protein